MPPSPAAILFDLDGTLVDTLPDLHTAMNLLLADLGRRAVSADEVSGWVGDGVGVLVERALAATGGHNSSGPEPGDPAAAVRRYVAHYSAHLTDGSRLYPGVANTLGHLKTAGHPLGICTNKPTAEAERLLGALGIAPFFAAIVGGDGASARKPDPRHLLETLARMGAEGRKALMVGDGPNDALAARAAKMPVVIVSYGYSHGDPRALGADIVIDDFAGLPEAAREYL